MSAPYPGSGGISIGPRSCTSASRRTPNCSWARLRASAISARASAEEAPPAFSMKFACLGEICAPPIRCPFSPQASSMRPAVSSWSGFLNTLPNVRLFVGCASFRFCCISLTDSLISASGFGWRPNSAPATTWPRTRSERRQPASAATVDDVGLDEDCGDVVPVCAGVHPDAAADRTGNRADELDPAEVGCACTVEADGERRGAPGDQAPLSDLDGREHSVELERKPRETLVCDEQVGAQADRSRRDVVLLGPREEVGELLDQLGLREPPRSSPGPERRELGEADILLDLHAPSLSSSSGTAWSTSPAPIVTTRSPERARAPRSSAPCSTLGVQATGIRGRSSQSRSTTSLPVTPSIGSSRAG